MSVDRLPQGLLPRVIRFCIVGVATAILQICLLYAAVALAGLDPTLGSCLAFIIVVIFNYLMHYNWTFAEPAPHTKTLSRYLFMILAGFLINGLVMYLGASHFGMYYLLIQALAIGLVVSCNFFVSLLWVFRP